MATETLTQAELDSIYDGNLHKKVPTGLYDTNLLNKYEEITQLTGVASTEDIKFDPEVHLSYYADLKSKNLYDNTKTMTMEELGLTREDQISPIGVSEPFPLFTMEAINLMRQEVLARQLFLEYARFSYSSTNGMDIAMRGYVKNDEKISAPFTYSAWTNPKTMELISRMAGVELDIVMDYEIAHLNVAINDEAKVKAAADAAKAKGAVEAKHDLRNGGENIPAVVGWHNDSYPFVCVLMLSDCTNMIGGETYMRKGNGEVDCVQCPQQGYGCILQGRIIEHLAPSPLGLSERITMVTSYRSKNNLDDSVLSTVKPEINYGSRFADFYSQWVQYRMELAGRKLAEMKLTSTVSEGRFAKEQAIKQLQSLEKYIHSTWNEMTVNENEWERSKLGFKDLKV